MLTTSWRLVLVVVLQKMLHNLQLAVNIIVIIIIIIIVIIHIINITIIIRISSSMLLVSFCTTSD